MLMTPAQLDELADKVADRVVAKSATTPRLVDRQALAAALGISVPTIERLQRDGTISVVRIRGRVLYEVDEVINQLTAETKAARDYCPPKEK